MKEGEGRRGQESGEEERRGEEGRRREERGAAERDTTRAFAKDSRQS